MTIVHLLERNAREFGRDVALVELNPSEARDQVRTWREMNLIEGAADAPYRRELTWADFGQLPPTCEAAQTCALCGDTEGLPLGHDWQAASCTAPKTCTVCGATDGEVAPHAWVDATYVAPKTCSVCGLTEGEPIVPDFVFLYELEPCEQFGKYWLLSSVEPDFPYHTGRDTPRCWSDLDTPGYTGGVVRDSEGHVYTYGFHLDGDTSSKYFISYRINGNYTELSGAYAFPETTLSIPYDHYTKYFEVYGDGELLYTSDTMNSSMTRRTFSVNITGVQVLTIQYPATKGPNETVTIFDAKLD